MTSAASCPANPSLTRKRFLTYRLSGQALRGALDLAVGWADPQETSPETAGLGLALDDGMETTHGR